MTEELSAQQVQVVDEFPAAGDDGQEAVTTASLETPEITAVLDEKRKDNSVRGPSPELIRVLREAERNLRKNYEDPERITVRTSRGMVVHQDFTRKVGAIPDYILTPTPALVNGKPIQVGKVTVPEIRDYQDKLVKASVDYPVYVAADKDGSPLRDSRGNFVVIDPQTGAIRQRMKVNGLPKRRWWTIQYRRLLAWWKGWKLDFKFVKKTR